MRVSSTVGSEGQQGTLLKGSDVLAAGKRFVGGVVLEVREGPQGFGSPAIIDFDSDVLPGIHSWPVNVTNMRRLAVEIGDDTAAWEGWGIMLQVVHHQPNARGQKFPPGMAVYSVEEPKKVAKNRKTKATYKRGAASKNGPAPFAPTADECPF